MKKCIILFLLPLIFLSASILADWKNWQSEDGKISINYPESWNFNASFPGTVFSIKTERSDEQDFFREFLTLIIENNGSTTSEAYAESLKLEFPGAEVVSNREINVSGQKAVEIVFTFSQAIFEFKAKKVILFKNDLAYSLAYTAEKANYDKYLVEVDSMIASFNLKD